MSKPINIKIIDSPRPSTVEEELNYYKFLYSEIAEIANNAKCRLLGSPTHIKIIKDIVLERDELKENNKKLKLYVSDMAEGDCSYGDCSPFNSKHKQCYSCKAKEILKECK